MTKETLRKLAKINDQVAKKYRHSFIRKEKPWEFEEDIVRMLLPMASPKEKYMLEKAMDHPLMREKHDKVVERVNDETTKKMDEEVQWRIKEAIKKGELPDPKKDRSYHAFMRKIWGKQKRINEDNRVSSLRAG